MAWRVLGGGRIMTNSMMDGGIAIIGKKALVVRVSIWSSRHGA